ncbi:hypothetical protein ACTXJY_14245 [Corynebacterium casei]|uniref:hypothetical protein n=1 Tax=Corynebacterium casei TaxID=160386 RepID=UPI003FD3D15A
MVKIPQTRILEYRRAAYDRYLNACWPDGLDSYGEDSPILDLTELYSKQMENQVIFIQNTFDTHHMYEHMIPFFGCIPNESRENLFLKTSYWGKQGHSNSVPLIEWDTWARAAVLAPTASAVDIADEYLRLDLEKGPKLGQFKDNQNRAIKSDRRKPEIQDMDLEWVRMVVQTQYFGE